MSTPFPLGLVARSAPDAAPPKVTFLLPAETFELIYGEEHRAAVATRATILNTALIDEPQGLVAAPPPWLRETEFAFTGWGSPQLDAALLARLPRLRAVFHGGGTVRPHVSEALWARGITLTSAAAANAIPVAEFTLAAILLGLKQAWPLARAVRRTRTFPAERPSVPGARGSTVGLISLGLIGQLVRERLRPFDVRVIGCDPYLPLARFRALGIEPVALRELMERSDVVSIHTSLHPDTAGFITRELLDRLKPGATFINTARGGLVREPELIAFLRARPDVQAILDVTDPEPPPASSPLYDLPNVFLTPHLAGSLGPECRRLGAAAVAEFARYLQGEPLHHAVTREQVERQT